MNISQEELAQLYAKSLPNIDIGRKSDEDLINKVKHFEIRDSDILVMGYPRSGTTWTVEMVWLIVNNLDFEGAKTSILERFPLLEYSILDMILPEEIIRNRPYFENSFGFIGKQKDPRFIKTHLGSEHLPLQIQNGTKKPKIIFVARNIKDTCVAMYHFLKDIIHVFTGNLDDYCKLFLSGDGRRGYYWDYVLYFWKRRNEPNFLFIKYEDMKKDLPETIRKVAAFLNKSLSEEQIIELTHWLDFNTMKNNQAVNLVDLYEQGGFIRRGIVGSFKEELSPEWIEIFDQWTKSCLDGTGLDMQ